MKFSSFWEEDHEEEECRAGIVAFLNFRNESRTPSDESYDPDAASSADGESDELMELESNWSSVSSEDDADLDVQDDGRRKALDLLSNGRLKMDKHSSPKTRESSKRLIGRTVAIVRRILEEEGLMQGRELAKVGGSMKKCGSSSPAILRVVAASLVSCAGMGFLGVVVVRIYGFPIVLRIVPPRWSWSTRFSTVV